MSNSNTTIAVTLYKSKTLANGEHPLMLRVTKDRKRKYISLGISCNPKLWNSKTNEPRKNHPDKDVLTSIIFKKIQSYNTEILNHKDDGKDFTPETLIKKVEIETKRITVFQFFDQHIQSLEESKKIGYAKTFRDTKAQIKTYTKKDLSFHEIDSNWLEKFESWLRSKDLADNSISIRMRTLRTLWNEAIVKKYARQENYPFNEYKISKFSTDTRKRAISKDNIKAIESLELKPYSAIFEAQQYFIFSYYAQGINFVDIAQLKWENLEDGRITYVRAKTKQKIVFRVSTPLERILNLWRPFTGNSKDNYIFPILKKDKHLTPQQQYDRTRKVLKRTNKHLKAIGETIGLDTPLTTYVARHSFATVLKQSGVSIGIISETLGHRTESITSTYLKDFEDSIINEALENL